VPRYVFSKLPKWAPGMKPGLLWVRCPKCGWPHQEYFGPRNRDEIAATLQFFSRALAAAFAILEDRQRARRRTPRAAARARRRSKA
jgi:hypothetical protein